MSRHYSMSPADAAWLRMDRATNLMVINAPMWFDEPPDWERLRSVYVERIVDRFPRFRQIPHEGGVAGAHWEDAPSFDPDDHFHRIALPAPHDRAALRTLVADLATAPLDHERALWDVYLIDDVGGGAAVLTRVHHAVADGIALGRVLLSATDAGDAGPGFGAPTGTGPRSRPSCTAGCRPSGIPGVPRHGRSPTWARCRSCCCRAANTRACSRARATSATGSPGATRSTCGASSAWRAPIK